MGINSFELQNQKTYSIKFNPLKCFEAQSENVKKEYREESLISSTVNLNNWQIVDPKTFFESSNGELKQCGYISYLKLAEVDTELKRWIEFVNTVIMKLNVQNSDQDFLLELSKIQRWFIIIHPFDLYLPENEWAKEFGDGLLRTSKNLENCFNGSDQSGCDEVK